MCGLNVKMLLKNVQQKFVKLDFQFDVKTHALRLPSASSLLFSLLEIIWVKNGAFLCLMRLMGVACSHHVEHGGFVFVSVARPWAVAAVAAVAVFAAIVSNEESVGPAVLDDGWKASFCCSCCGDANVGNVCGVAK